MSQCIYCARCHQRNEGNEYVFIIGTVNVCNNNNNNKTVQRYGKKWVAHKISVAYVRLFRSFVHFVRLQKLHMTEKDFVYPWHRENDIFSIIIALIIQFRISSYVICIKVFTLSFTLSLIESKTFHSNASMYNSHSGSNTEKTSSKNKTETKSLFEFIQFWVESPNRCLTCGNVN